ncbi:UvrD-helicase domain-containing protein [Streptosporangium sp. NPDC049376]|uniref:UvrD-helicase domain-containing protein n=1 Tax=Streptosporangium sp. NPDC049376 TaxID=3366192 RepID=UPI0037AC5E00
MSDAYQDSPPLTAEQRAVVEQPAEARVLVTAGAGAGKTHTLIRRLDRLVAEEDLSAGEILMLTFSRAAVRELRNRLSQYGDAARFVQVQTFDSWALDVLTQVDAMGGWGGRSFDSRIVGARDVVDSGKSDELYEHGLRHVVIDEVQDLVGDRRDLVEALLDRYDCGFTVVGDPAQSVYGFTVRNSQERKAETNRFFEWLRVAFGEELTELELTENFRARTEDAKVALRFGPRLRKLSESGNVEGEKLYDGLRDVLGGVLDFGDFDKLAADALTGHDGTAAILCRTNGQALLVSEMLHAVEVPHRLQRSARDRAAPAWLGRLLAKNDSSTLTRERFGELVGGPDADRLWRLLRRTARGSGSDRLLDLSAVRTAIAAGRLPDELTAQQPAKLVVSSFHRAKGLEFDRVLVLDPGPIREGRNGDERDAAEEARLLYVAMTRPREELYRLDGTALRYVKVDRRTLRWSRPGYKGWMRMGLELHGGDVLTEHPAGTLDFEGDAVELQEYLATIVQPGDAVKLERLFPEPIGVLESPPYLVLHNGRSIGTASEQFRKDLYTHLKNGKNYIPRNFPALISGVHVDTLETVAGNAAAGVRAGLNAHGVWLAPRLVGLSTFTWDKKDVDVEAS